MGPKVSNSNKTFFQSTPNLQYNKNHFDFLAIIGRGGFSKIYQAYNRKLNQQFAVKKMSKISIIAKNSVENIINERNILAAIYHPFINYLYYIFQDHENIYFVFEMLKGGDLRYHLHKCGKFTEEQTKFFIACALLALEYLHTNNIIHRDLKPENMVLDWRGYAKLIDFGFANYYHKDNYNETSGTPGYLAPEILNSKTHTIAVDYYALGVITYEFMKGSRPYKGTNRKELKQQIMLKQAKLTKSDIPNGWSTAAVDFINSLLQRKSGNRLGLRGPSEVKEHPWFNNYPWRDLYNGKLLACYVQTRFSKDNYDFIYVNEIQEDQDKVIKLYKMKNYSDPFKSLEYYDWCVIENNDVIRRKNIVNPHTIYEEDFYNDGDDNKSPINKESNLSCLNKTDRFIGRLNSEKNSYSRTTKTSLSTKVLLKEYDKSLSIMKENN